MILSSELLKSTGIYQTSSGIDLGSIKATQAAIDFYKEQAKAKQIFDAIERENKEFREAIGVLKRYPDKYTGDLDLPTSIWRDKYKENLFLKNDCIHGTNCQRINNCSCTPKREVEQNEKELEERHQLDHNHKHKSKSKKQKKKEVARY